MLGYKLKVCADLSSALAHSCAVHKRVTDERTVAAWLALGCYVRQNCQLVEVEILSPTQLSYKKYHQSEGPPSNSPSAPGKRQGPCTP